MQIGLGHRCHGLGFAGMLLFRGQAAGALGARQKRSPHSGLSPAFLPQTLLRQIGSASSLHLEARCRRDDNSSLG